MFFHIEFDELDKLIEVEDEATSTGLDETVAAAAAVDEAVALDETTVVVGFVVTSKRKRKTSEV
jgi:hypothetical protein